MYIYVQIRTSRITAWPEMEGQKSILSSELRLVALVSTVLSPPMTFAFFVRASRGFRLHCSRDSRGAVA